MKPTKEEECFCEICKAIFFAVIAKTFVKSAKPLCLNSFMTLTLCWLGRWIANSRTFCVVSWSIGLIDPATEAMMILAPSLLAIPLYWLPLHRPSGRIRSPYGVCRLILTVVSVDHGRL